MPVAIVIEISGQRINAELNDSATAKAILSKLPIESEFSTWGDEIYFPIPVKRGVENGKDVVAPGELGYWPPGNAFCIFYGATPVSTKEEIRPASSVNSIGYVVDDPKVFCALAQHANRIRITLA